MVIAFPDYLAEYGTPTTPQALINHKTISYNNIKQARISRFIHSNGKSSDVKIDNHVLTNSSEMALCLAGKEIPRLPSFNLHGEIEEGRLIELFPTYKKQQIDVQRVYPSRRHMPSKVR